MFFLFSPVVEFFVYGSHQGVLILDDVESYNLCEAFLSVESFLGIWRDGEEERKRVRVGGHHCWSFFYYKNEEARDINSQGSRIVGQRQSEEDREREKEREKKGERKRN